MSPATARDGAGGGAGDGGSNEVDIRPVARPRSLQTLQRLAAAVKVRIEHLPDRIVAVVAHHGPPETVDVTRRPLYQHMILNELVGGPSILRFLDKPQGDHVVDALVTTHLGFEGDEVCTVERLPAGEYAVLDFEGPPAAIAEARRKLREWVPGHGRRAKGPMLQVHLMDPVDGVFEQQLQVPLQ